MDYLLCVSLCSRDNGSNGIRSNAAKVYGCYICLRNKSVGIGCSDERIAILPAAAYRLQLCSGLPLITCLLQFTVCYWSNVNATNNNALYTQGLIFTAHTNASTLFAPNSPSPSVTTHLPVHLITPGNMPTFQSQSPISPRPAHIECHTNNLASSSSHLTYSVSNLFTSLHVYHTLPRLLNILIFKVRSDPGIASPGRFAWA